MFKVIATDVSKKYNLRLKELHRVAQPGEIFEVTDDRFVYLNGNNPKGYVVVEWYQEPEVDTPVVEESVPEVDGQGDKGKDFDTVVEMLNEMGKAYNVSVDWNEDSDACPDGEFKDVPEVKEEKPKKKRTTKKATDSEGTPVKKTTRKKTTKKED